MTDNIQVTAEIALDFMRDQREQGEANGIFYLVGQRPGEEPALVMVPCIEPPQVTATLIPVMAENEDMTIDSVVMCVDTYRYIDTSPPGPDDLGTLFAAGDPRVSEAIVASCVEKDGPGWYVAQSYIKHENGIVWGDPEHFDARKVEVESASEIGARLHWQGLRHQMESILR